MDERGRPLDRGREAVQSLSDEELETELTIAPGRVHFVRYKRLLSERQRRRLVPP